MCVCVCVHCSVSAGTSAVSVRSVDLMCSESVTLHGVGDNRVS